MPPMATRIARQAANPIAPRTIDLRRLNGRSRKGRLLIAWASFGDPPPVSRRQWLIDEGERRLAFHIVDLAHAEHRAQAVGRHLEWTRRGRRPRGRLRISGGPGRVEGHVALDLLEHLVDMAVEHRHRAEAAQAPQRFGAIRRAPAPAGVDGPERNMSEDDNGRAGGKTADVILEPGDLVRAQGGEAAGLEADHVDQGDEMDALAIEAVPAVAFRARAMAFQIGLAIVEPVMLARHTVNIAADVLDDLLSRVELTRLREMGDVAGMDDE